MADTSKKFQTRTFTKKVGDETKTRQVTSPQAEIAARFDGFYPEGEGPDAKPAAKSTGGSAAGRPTAGTAGGGGTSS